MELSVFDLSLAAVTETAFKVVAIGMVGFAAISWWNVWRAWLSWRRGTRRDQA